METLTAAKFKFGDFEMDCSRRSLTRDGMPLALNAKAFDLLHHLVENHGKVLSKGELLDSVWPGQFVEENNLTVQISALRKVLGDRNGSSRFIATVPGRGYSFVADVDTSGDSEVVFEKRTFSRIVVDDEIHTSSSICEPNRDPKPKAGHALTNPKSVVNLIKHSPLAISLTLLTFFLLFGSGYVFRSLFFSSSVSGDSFTKHSVRQLTSNGKVGNAALSPDGGMFAYTVDELGQKSLWLGFVDGGNQILLREPSETSYRNIAFSPDNSHIYFSIQDKKNPIWSLFKIPVFGGVQTKVLDNVSYFSLAPDGKSVALTRSDNETNQVFVVIASIDGSERRDLMAFPREGSCVPGTISWSLDGSHLALASVIKGTVAENEMVFADVKTGTLDRVGVNGIRDISKTAWLASGSGILITAQEESSRSSVPQYEIWHMSLPGGDISPVTTDRSNYGASWHNDAGATLSLSGNANGLLTVEHRQLTNVWVAPADDLSDAHPITNGSFGKYDGLWGLDWTPDGKLIYTTSDTRSQFLAEMNADGTGQKPLTGPGKVDSVLTVSNDGKYVVFHSDRNSEMDIWRTDVDGANPKQLTFGGKAFHPAPSSDGRWVYYKNYLTGRGELCRVLIDGGEPECLNDKETSWISFSPDGKYFAASYFTDKQRLAIFSALTNQIVNQFELPNTGTLFMGSRWTPDSKAVAYRDKNVGYWLQPIDGGEARQMEGLPKEKLYNFAWSKDGRWFAFVRGQEIRDVILFTSSNGPE